MGDHLITGRNGRSPQAGVAQQRLAAKQLPVTVGPEYEYYVGHDIERNTMETVAIRDEFIKLGQVMKLAGMVDSGVDAKMVIQDGEVLVNGEVDTRRGRKIVPGDVISFRGQEIEVVSK